MCICQHLWDRNMFGISSHPDDYFLTVDFSLLVLPVIFAFYYSLQFWLRITNTIHVYSLSQDTESEWPLTPTLTRPMLHHTIEEIIEAVLMYSIFFHPLFLCSVSVLIFNTTSHCFVLVKQFRPGTFSPHESVVWWSLVILFSSCYQARYGLLYICRHLQHKSSTSQSLFILLELCNNAES